MPGKAETIVTPKRRLAQAVRPARTVFRNEVGAAVNDAVGPSQAGLHAELRDLRRVLEDDLNAASETAAVFGRLLAQLRDRMDGLEARLGAIETNLAALQPAPPGSPSQARQNPSQARHNPSQGRGRGPRSGSAKGRPDPAS